MNLTQVDKKTRLTVTTRVDKIVELALAGNESMTHPL